MRQIKDFPDYFVSEDGKVWNQKTLRYVEPLGENVELSFNGLKRVCKVDDLVSEVYPALKKTEKKRKRRKKNTQTK